ncbi:MAG: undecaprenyl/decaprenyl-phosphate alpha-N-acetylglucosaminyl 1-phosphate transferase [Coriobacteriia bacterium]|nr:undecaprenyl/decaprenyl-phosphate alpha-N-acetylglucosaminyl 1-phosphate transferase [Coriobacteriia bacterium]
MSLQHIALLVGVAAAVTLLLTPFVRRASLRLGLVDEPGGRKIHSGLIPRVGGVAMLGGFAVAFAVQFWGESYLGWRTTLTSGNQQIVGCVVGMLVIFAVGLIDDIVGLNAGQKLLGQLAAAGVLIGFGLRIEFIGNPFGGLLMLGLLGVPVTALYVVAFTNVINLIDGLDGLAAGVSAIGAATMLVLALQGNELAAAVFAAALIGACVGFLRYNFHPASIFMGDSGAMFLGFSLAAISLLGVMKSVAAIALAVPLLIIGVPIFDTASAIIRRVRHKRPIQEADRGHIHHRLLGRGFDQRQTVLIIYVWSAALGVGAYAMRWAATSVKLLTFGVLAGLSVFMAYWLGLFEVAYHHAEEQHDGASIEPDDTPFDGVSGTGH